MNEFKPIKIKVYNVPIDRIGWETIFSQDSEHAYLVNCEIRFGFKYTNILYDTMEELYCYE